MHVKVKVNNLVNYDLLDCKLFKSKFCIVLHLEHKFWVDRNKIKAGHLLGGTGKTNTRQVTSHNISQAITGVQLRVRTL